MKKIVLIIMVALFLALNLSALTWNGFNPSNFNAYATPDDPK